MWKSGQIPLRGPQAGRLEVDQQRVCVRAQNVAVEMWFPMQRLCFECQRRHCFIQRFVTTSQKRPITDGKLGRQGGVA